MNDYKELIGRLKALGEYLKFDKESCVYLAADAIEQLDKDINALTKERDELKEVNILLTANCNHFKKERDAAVADLHLVANNCFEDYTFSACCCCKKNNTCNGQPAIGCEFEWRGVKEDNDEAD